jgi:hypothetical protein
MDELESTKLVMIIPNTKIDNICEKFLDALRSGRRTVEIFVNASKRDIKNVRDAEGSYSKNIRFIADGNSKKIYCWNAGLYLHDSMLRWLKENGYIGNNVKLYNDPDVTSGEWNSRDEIELFYNVNWGPAEMGNVIMDGDWAWVGKTGFKDFERKLMKTVYDEMRSSGKEIDPAVAKAAGM